MPTYSTGDHEWVEVLMPPSSTEDCARAKEEEDDKAADRIRGATEGYERKAIAYAREREEADKSDEPRGRECLSLTMRAIESQRFDSPLFHYVADCIDKYLRGVSIEEAFNVVPPESKGGRPAKYDPIEIAALDILLRDHGHLGPEQSISWMQEHVGESIDRRFVQRVRAEHDKRYNRDADCPLMESFTRDLLLHLSGSLRKYVGHFPNNLPKAPEPTMR